jgi:hypothetical protein
MEYELYKGSLETESGNPEKTITEFRVIKATILKDSPRVLK